MQHLLQRPADSWIDLVIDSEVSSDRMPTTEDTFYDAVEAWPKSEDLIPHVKALPATEQIWTPLTSCRSWCQCICHKRKSWQLGTSIAATLGCIRIAYTGGGYWYPSPCSLVTCENRQTHTSSIALCAPKWLLSRAILISTSGFKTIIELPRVRPASDTPFSYSENGNVRALHESFQNNEASPYDVDENGWSLLHNACFYGHGPMIKYLLEKSADADMRTQVYETPREKSLSAIFQGAATQFEWSKDNIEFISTCLDLPSWIQEQNFSRLHKVILGLYGGPLTDSAMVHYTYEEIEAKDAMGRTPLWWAVARGTVEQTAILVRNGACATIKDGGGWSPLCMAIARIKTEHLRALLP